MIEKLLEEIKYLNDLDQKSIAERVVKFNEEFGEFSAEIVKVLGITHKPYERELLIEEAADALQCQLSLILSLCQKLNISFEEILVKMKSKNEKWKSKISNYVPPTSC